MSVVLMTALRTVVNLSLRCLNDGLLYPSMQIYNLNGELLTSYCCDFRSSVFFCRSG